MKVKHSIGFYIGTLLKHFASLLYQNIFAVDSFKYLNDEDDIEVIYCVTGKRTPKLKKKLSQIIKDEKILECFSRKDICEMGVFYGRIVEKRHHKKFIERLELEINESKRVNNENGN